MKTMEIKVGYSASSNISYRGTWTLEVDDEEWAELDERGKDELLNELVGQEIANDISWYVKE